ncbi:MAG: GMC family oxidoreductase [Halioglobus sp.]
MGNDTAYDYIIVGSGFGGAVSALRLAEKGWRVALIEQGRRIDPGDIQRAKQKPSHLLWIPELGLKSGYFAQQLFKHVAIIGGVGLGGGSLVWAAVMLEPKDKFYDAPELAAMGIDWRKELAPHFATAKRMLGVAVNPYRSEQDALLEYTARAMHVAQTFGRVPNAICFESEPGTDPYFDGAGPPRNPCTRCGGCMTGCADNAKNSLDKNYLYFAEKAGVEILTEWKADKIESTEDQRYTVTLQPSRARGASRTLSAGKVVLSCGVIGTLELLMKNRDEYCTLPAVSPSLGRVVRTNSEAITAVLHPRGVDMTKGTGVSSDFYPDEHTHVTQNRFDRGYRIIRYLYGPMTEGTRPVLRALHTLSKTLLSPRLMLRNWFCHDWEKRVTLFTVMQDLDNAVGFTYRKDWRRGFRRRLQSVADPQTKAPTYLKVANDVARVYATLAGGTAMSSFTESVGNRSTTAHILSGCPMGPDPSNAVIDSNHEVHGHPGLFVVDASSIPANIGVNPSLTITAMAERFGALQPQREIESRGNPRCAGQNAK